MTKYELRITGECKQNLKNSLTSLRPAPPASVFRSCRGLFRGTFCRSALPLAIARTSRQNRIKNNDYEQENYHHHTARPRRHDFYS